MRTFTRRGLMAAGATLPVLAALPARPRAQPAARPLRIGVLADFSGPYRDTSGPTSVVCARQVVLDLGLEARGIPVEILQADHQNKADVERDTTAAVQGAGGKVLGGVRFPFPGTADFCSFLVQAQASRAKWRAVPAKYGPRWMAAQCFIRWGRHGVWERLLSLMQEKGVRLGMVFLDGSTIRAHQKAAGAAKKGDLKPDAMRVRLLADHVASMAPRPA